MDTFPYGGHTLSSDALWAGVPVVTRVGETFASRVAGSLLHAVGLDALIAADAGEYLAIAERLLGAAERRQTIRDHLETGRVGFALFDATDYARKFETALADVVQRRWPAETRAG